MKRLLCLFLPPLLAFAEKNDDLLAAARAGDLTTVQNLLQAGADLEAKTSYGQTPLFLSVMQGRTPVAAFLLENGAKTDVRDTFYKMGMVDIALQRKHFETVRLLLAKDAAVAGRHLQSLVMFGDKPTLEAALATSIPRDSLDRAVAMAIDMKKEEATALLLQAGAKAPEPAMAVDARILDAYAGTYKSEQLPLELKFWVKDGKLVGQLSGQPEFTPRPKSNTQFSLASVGAAFEFSAPDTVTLKQGQGTYTFKRVKP